MSVEIPEMVGMDAANAELDRLIAADAATDDPAAATPPDQSAPGGDPATGVRAAQTDKTESTQAQVEVRPPNSEKKDDTIQQDPKVPAAPATTADDPSKSRYQKAVDRQQRGWSELNAQKDAFKAEQETLRRERDEFTRLRTEHETRASREKNQFTAEDYERAANQWDEQGKPDLAELARKQAEQVRKNPPDKVAAREKEAFTAQHKEWTLKAGVDFPELVKQNSALQIRVAQLLKDEPDMQAHPKGMYLAARLADLENRAAEVSSLKSQLGEKDKKLGQMEARVKELETLTAPGGPGNATHLPGAKTFEQMSEAEQFQDLERQAREQGTLYR